MSRRLGAAAVLALLTLSSVAAAERPRSMVLDGGPGLERVQLPPTGLVPYNTVYLNRCASGCSVKGNSYSNSQTDSWYLPGGATRVLTSFPYGDEAWDKVVACVRDVMSPFQINIVTQNPGSANHFEIMIAGASTDLGGSAWASYGGVAPGNGECGGYVNNGLVFAFAKAYGVGTTCDDSCVNEICATASQEIGHVWSAMDHVRLASDPMTYFGFAGRRYFQNMDAQCGSDCVNGVAPSGETCSGASNQSHTCTCGSQTQNSYQIIRGMFGAGQGTPPDASITSPTLGENVDQEFNIVAEVADDSMIISRVDFKVDGQVIQSLNRGPFVVNAPAGLADGTHRVEVIAYDGHQTPGSAMVDVVIGPPCEGNDDCSRTGDVCLGGRCVVGPSVNGGLGTSCTNSDMCASLSCASDGTDSFCVEQCMVGQCPDDFGCLEFEGGAEGTGVCWPGYDDGSGGCGCQSTRGGPAGMLLAFLVMVLTCRRRRR